MDKSIIGLVAALAAAAPLAHAEAAVSPEDAAKALQASSVAELLDPVPNSAAILAALDANREAQPPAADKGVQVAQWHHHHHHNWGWGGGWGHHHHHHNYYWRRRYHHHHHHYWGGY